MKNYQPEKKLLHEAKPSAIMFSRVGNFPYAMSKSMYVFYSTKNPFVIPHPTPKNIKLQVVAVIDLSWAALGSWTSAVT